MHGNVCNAKLSYLVSVGGEDVVGDVGGGELTGEV